MVSKYLTQMLHSFAFVGLQPAWTLAHPHLCVHPHLHDESFDTLAFIYEKSPKSKAKFIENILSNEEPT